MSELTNPCFKCGEVYWDRDLVLFDYCHDTGEEYPVCPQCVLKLEGKCPNCKSEKIVINQGSTNLKPINEKMWGLCQDCLFEWELSN